MGADMSPQEYRNELATGSSHREQVHQPMNQRPQRSVKANSKIHVPVVQYISNHTSRSHHSLHVETTVMRSAWIASSFPSSSSAAQCGSAPNYSTYTRNNYSPNVFEAATSSELQRPETGFVYQVQFKLAFKNYFLGPSAPRDLSPGDFVKVEADRGQDMGVILSKCPIEQFQEDIPTAGWRGRGFTSGQGERKRILRRATVEERAALVAKVADEQIALEYVRAKVTERGFPMTVLDAEYQFDRHKLTFYFVSDRRIDFRDLVCELFALYNTRIWMQQVDMSSVTPNDAGMELARAAGFLQTSEKEFPVSSTRSSFTVTTTEPLSELNDSCSIEQQDFDASQLNVPSTSAIGVCQTFRSFASSYQLLIKSPAGNYPFNCQQSLDWHPSQAESLPFGMNFDESWFSEPNIGV